MHQGLKLLEVIIIELYQVILFLLVKHFISISDDPEIVAGDQGRITNNDVRLAKEWVIKNKHLLLMYWNSDIVTRIFLNKIERV